MNPTRWSEEGGPVPWCKALTPWLRCCQACCCTPTVVNGAYVQGEGIEQLITCGRVVLGVELCLEGAQSGSKGCGTCDCEVSLTSLTVHNYTV